MISCLQRVFCTRLQTRCLKFRLGIPTTKLSCGQRNPKRLDVKRLAPYLFHFHSLRRCRTRRRSAWRRCPFGAVAISCAGLPTGWTRWRRCQRSGPSPCWFPGTRKRGYPRCSEVLLQNWEWRLKPEYWTVLTQLSDHYQSCCCILLVLRLFPARPVPSLVPCRVRASCDRLSVGVGLSPCPWGQAASLNQPTD